MVLNVTSGARGSIEEWIAAFRHVWDKPQERLDHLLNLLSDDVTLRAPTLPPVSHGKAEARAAFNRAFRGMPDLRADIHRWSLADEVLFIEITFEATIGGHRVKWDDVDVFTVKNGVAIQRVAFFDPTPVRRAFLRNFSAFRQYRRMRRGD
jgi:hypothetical protein